jgi:hypothetical protein
VETLIDLETLKSRFVDAALDQNWDECDRLREALQAQGELRKPYTADCCGPGRSGVVPSRYPKKERHRFFFSRMYGEDRCMYCNCEKKK